MVELIARVGDGQVLTRCDEKSELSKIEGEQSKLPLPHPNPSMLAQKSDLLGQT